MFYEYMTFRTFLSTSNRKHGQGSDLLKPPWLLFLDVCNSWFLEMQLIWTPSVIAKVSWLLFFSYQEEIQWRPPWSSVCDFLADDGKCDEQLLPRTPLSVASDTSFQEKVQWKPPWISLVCINMISCYFASGNIIGIPAMDNFFWLLEVAKWDSGDLICKCFTKDQPIAYYPYEEAAAAVRYFSGKIHQSIGTHAQWCFMQVVLFQYLSTVHWLSPVGLASQHTSNSVVQHEGGMKTESSEEALLPFSFVSSTQVHGILFLMCVVDNYPISLLSTKHQMSSLHTIQLTVFKWLELQNGRSLIIDLANKFEKIQGSEQNWFAFEEFKRPEFATVNQCKIQIAIQLVFHIQSVWGSSRVQVALSIREMQVTWDPSGNKLLPDGFEYHVCFWERGMVPVALLFVNIRWKPYGISWNKKGIVYHGISRPCVSEWSVHVFQCQHYSKYGIQVRSGLVLAWKITNILRKCDTITCDFHCPRMDQAKFNITSLPKHAMNHYWKASNSVQNRQTEPSVIVLVHWDPGDKLITIYSISLLYQEAFKITYEFLSSDKEKNYTAEDICRLNMLSGNLSTEYATVGRKNQHIAWDPGGIKWIGLGTSRIFRRGGCHGPGVLLGSKAAWAGLSVAQGGKAIYYMRNHQHRWGGVEDRTKKPAAASSARGESRDSIYLTLSPSYCSSQLLYLVPRPSRV